jgi:hypothetical protein
VFPKRAKPQNRNAPSSVWCALSTRGSDGSFLRPQIRDLLFAALEAHLSPALFEIRGDWPTGPLNWAEVVKLAIR